MTDLWYKPKLIEVALPLEDISTESAREKSIRRGHPSTLHLWWSRKPLAAARAVIFAQMVDDPCANPDKFPTEEAQKAERDRLHGIISRLVVWENIHDEKLLKEAHEEILKSTGGSPPPILDPFAGGGSIPLEAQRLGLEAHASDLNPVAVLINKALIEIPPKWSGCKPVFPGAAAERLSWPGTTGLAEDVRRYGKWMRDEAEKRIGHLYPKISISGIETTTIAWLWVRTVTCPNPACTGTMPLTSKFWLGQKKGKERYVIPIADGKHVRFEIAGPDGAPREGTIVGRTGAVCVICNTPVPMSYIREEGKAGRMGAQLMGIVGEGRRQRFYAAPNEDHEKAAAIPRPSDAPDSELPDNARWFSPPLYGMTKYGDLFTNRQLNAMLTLTRLVNETRERVIADGAVAEYADAISTYLALAASRVADLNNSIVTWSSSRDQARNMYARQAIAMSWDFVEVNPFGGAAGDLAVSIETACDIIRSLPDSPQGVAKQLDAVQIDLASAVVATDPPYYDNIGYADLSDFFYVWIRQSLARVLPELLVRQHPMGF